MQLAALLAAVLAAPVSALATSFTFQGTFDDGGTFSGSFTLDPPDPNITVFEITTTAGTTFGGFTYSSTNPNSSASAQVTPPAFGLIQFSFAVLNVSQLVIGVPGTSLETFAGGPINLSGGSFEQLFPPTGTFRVPISGTVALVPEPATSAMLLLGLALFGSRGVRRRPLHG